VKVSLRHSQATSERIEGAQMFCTHLTYCYPRQDPRAAIKAAAYFRAAPAEYAAIEETFNRGRPSCGRFRYTRSTVGLTCPNQPRPRANRENHSSAAAMPMTSEGMTSPDGPMACSPPPMIMV
jgi:hypothetical protein